MSMYPSNDFLQMDLMCLCLSSVSAIICGKGCVKKRCCKSSIVLYMPLVFNVRVVIVR